MLSVHTAIIHTGTLHPLKSLATSIIYHGSRETSIIDGREQSDEGVDEGIVILNEWYFQQQPSNEIH
jgi:hypothetical protein